MFLWLNVGLVTQLQFIYTEFASIFVALLTPTREEDAVNVLSYTKVNKLKEPAFKMF